MNTYSLINEGLKNTYARNVIELVSFKNKNTLDIKYKTELLSKLNYTKQYLKHKSVTVKENG